MANGQLILHCGARQVERPELDLIEAPPPTETWYPLAHRNVIDRVLTTLDGAGFQIRKQSFGLSQDNHRFFGVLDLANEIDGGVSLAVGIRNSTDKSLPIGFTCGNRVFCCDNLAFSSDILVVRKHTRFGEMRFGHAIAQAVTQLHSYLGVEARRIAWMREAEVNEDHANSLILQAYEKDIVGARLLPELIHEWREPSHDDFKPRTMWSLLNAFTEVLKDRQRTQPARAAEETIRLQSLLTGGMNFGLAV